MQIISTDAIVTGAASGLGAATAAALAQHGAHVYGFDLVRRPTTETSSYRVWGWLPLDVLSAGA